MVQDDQRNRRNDLIDVAHAPLGQPSPHANTRVGRNANHAPGADMAFFVKGHIVFDDTDFAGLA